MSNRSAYAVEYMVEHWVEIASVLGLAAGGPSPSAGSPVRSSPVLLPPPPIGLIPVAGASTSVSAMGTPLPPPAVTAVPSNLTKLPSGAVASPVALRKGPPPLPGAGGLGRPPSTSMSDVSKVPPPPAAAALPPPPAAAVLPPPGAAVLPAPIPVLPHGVGAGVPVVTASPVAARRALPTGPSVGSLATANTVTPPPPSVLPASPTLPPGARYAHALYDWVGDASKGQLNLKKGVSIVVLQEHAAGWSTIEVDGQRGYCPSSYYK